MYINKMISEAAEKGTGNYDLSRYAYREKFCSCKLLMKKSVRTSTQLLYNSFT